LRGSKVAALRGVKDNDVGRLISQVGAWCSELVAAPFDGWRQPFEFRSRDCKLSLATFFCVDKDQIQ
jgi:hypothetical protein